VLKLSLLLASGGAARHAVGGGLRHAPRLLK